MAGRCRARSYFLVAVKRVRGMHLLGTGLEAAPRPGLKPVAVRAPYPKPPTYPQEPP